MSQWQAVLELDHNRTITDGSEAALCDAVRNGADLRVYTEFRHYEHIDVTSDCPEIVQEAAEFRVTCLLDDRWVAGFMTLRQPIALPGPDGYETVSNKGSLRPRSPRVGSRTEKNFGNCGTGS